MYDLLPVSGVDHLGMELDSGNPAVLALKSCQFRIGSSAGRAKALGQLEHLVSVAHPDLAADLYTVQEGRILEDSGQSGPSVLSGFRCLDVSAKLIREGLQAVAYPQYGNSQLQDFSVQLWRIRLVYCGRTAR